MRTDWRDTIINTPDILHGKARIKGTRIPASLVLGYLADGKSKEEIIRDFPNLNQEHIAACLDYARDLAEIEVAAS